MKRFLLIGIGIAIAAVIIIVIVVCVARSDSETMACIGNLAYLSGAKSGYALHNERTNGWNWTNNEYAIQELVAMGYLKNVVPSCPSSRHKFSGIATSTTDYLLNPIGSNPVCTIKPKRHKLP
jgi:hypothetical protein